MAVGVGEFDAEFFGREIGIDEELGARQLQGFSFDRAGLQPIVGAQGDEAVGGESGETDAVTGVSSIAIWIASFAVKFGGPVVVDVDEIVFDEH